MTDEKQKMIIAKNLLALIEKNGTDQKTVAEDLGINRPTFNQWVKAKSIPSLIVLRQLAKYFGVSINDIIDEKSKKTRLTQAIEPFLSDETLYLVSRYHRAPKHQQKTIMDLLR